MRYLHGGDVYRDRVEYDFSININPLGMPQECVKAAKEGVALSSARYPDYRGEALCRAISAKKKIKEDYIILGNGAAELLYGLCQFLRPKKGRVAVPSFQEYERALVSAGAELSAWGLQEGDGFALSPSFVDSLQGGEEIVFLCNPNNPTGRIIEREQLQRIMIRCEETDTYLCIDECFLPFLGQERENELSVMQELEKYPHLVILRAFTKIYGMPGLRLGYACTANFSLLEGIRGVLQPWNTSIPAQMAGIAALQCDSYLTETYELIAKEKKFLLEELADGLAEKIYLSEGNYILLKSRRDLKERLLEKGILIRSCADFRNLSEGYFRIAVRRHSENKELIRRWRSLN